MDRVGLRQRKVGSPRGEDTSDVTFAVMLTTVPTMNIPRPHFFLYSESADSTHCNESSVGHWRFRLESVDKQVELEAADDEPDVSGPRLELLAVVRGLEALDQPSRVTLVTPSRYVSRGLKFGLDSWREGDWQWQRFGEMTAVKDEDLWRRVDRALHFHKVECRTWRFDAGHGSGDSSKRHIVHFPRTEVESGPRDDAAKPRKQTVGRRLVAGAMRSLRGCLRTGSARKARLSAERKIPAP